MSEGAKRAILEWSRRITKDCPRVKIDNFGRDRVTKACTDHGWAFAPGEKPSKKAT